MSNYEDLFSSSYECAKPESSKTSCSWSCKMMLGLSRSSPHLPHCKGCSNLRIPQRRDSHLNCTARGPQSDICSRENRRILSGFSPLWASQCMGCHWKEGSPFCEASNRMTKRLQGQWPGRALRPWRRTASPRDVHHSHSFWWDKLAQLQSLRQVWSRGLFYLCYGHQSWSLHS